MKPLTPQLNDDLLKPFHVGFERQRLRGPKRIQHPEEWNAVRPTANQKTQGPQGQGNVQFDFALSPDKAPIGIDVELMSRTESRTSVNDEIGYWCHLTDTLPINTGHRRI